MNERDFILDNFEEEEKDKRNNEPLFPSININDLSDEKAEKLFEVLQNGINKIISDLAKIDDDDDIPFW